MFCNEYIYPKYYLNEFYFSFTKHALEQDWGKTVYIPYDGKWKIITHSDYNTEFALMLLLCSLLVYARCL